MEEIKFTHTPKSCKECDEYVQGKKKNKCKLKKCKYPAYRGIQGFYDK